MTQSPKTTPNPRMPLPTPYATILGSTAHCFAGSWRGCGSCKRGQDTGSLRPGHGAAIHATPTSAFEALAVLLAVVLLLAVAVIVMDVLPAHT